MRSKLASIFLLPFCASVLLSLSAAPLPVASTFLGGSDSDVICGIATDATGAVYAVGIVQSTNFPTTHLLQAGGQAFVAKFSADGHTLVYSTVIGSFVGRGIAVDSQGSAYLVGLAFPTGFPLSATNAQSQFGGGTTDAAVIKLSPDGSTIVYATYMGGSGDELAKAIAVDELGNAYIVGSTTSADLPVTSGVVQPHPGGGGDAFVAKINPAGSAFVYLTYLGGTNEDDANGIWVDAQHRVYLTGQTFSPAFISGPKPTVIGPADNPLATPAGDAFVARLSATGGSLDYLTLIRGSGMDDGVAITADSTGSAVVTGVTTSADFPTTGGAVTPTFQGWQDLFVAGLTAAGDALEFATYLGTGGYESFQQDYYTGKLWYGNIALNSAGEIYLCANTTSSAWPGANGVGIPGSSGGPVVIKLSSTGAQIDWLKYLGGTEGNGFFADGAWGLALGPQGAIWAAGDAVRPVFLPAFPTTKPVLQNFGGGSEDGFLVKLSESPGTAANYSFAARIVLDQSIDTTPFSTIGVTNVAHGGALWWSWMAPSSGRLTLRLDASATNSFVPILTAYSGTTQGALTVLATNLNGAIWTNLLQFSVQAGATYQFAVGPSATEVDEGLFSLEFSAPANDDFAQPATIPNRLPVTVTGSNVNATSEFGEIPINQYPGVNGFGESVWWQWTSPTNATISISVTGSDFDALVQAYVGTTLDNTLQPVSSVPLNQITIDANVGTIYQIAVFGRYNSTGNIQLALAKALPPSNDDFTNATVLVENAGPASVSNRNATSEPGEPVLYATGNGFHSVWWKWTAPGREFAHLTVWNGNVTPGVGVFTGAALGQLQPVAAAAFPGTVYGASNDVFFATSQNVTYYVLVNDQVSSAGGALNISLQTTPFLILPGTFRLSVGGIPSFEAAGQAGSNYVIQSSTDLRVWSLAPGGTFTGPDFTYTGASGGAVRFFRVMPAN